MSGMLYDSLQQQQQQQHSLKLAECFVTDYNNNIPSPT